jgi:hypothetical protein
MHIAFSTPTMLSPTGDVLEKRDLIEKIKELESKNFNLETNLKL